jgi:hypothetical protein
LEKLVNEGGFPMVNVGNNGEISNFQRHGNDWIMDDLRAKGGGLCTVFAGMARRDSGECFRCSGETWIHPSSHQRESARAKNFFRSRAWRKTVSVLDAVTPVIRVAAVVFESKNPQMVRMDPKVDGVGEFGHDGLPDVLLKDSERLWICQNRLDGTVAGVKEPSPQSGDPLFVKPGRFDEFSLGVGV